MYLPRIKSANTLERIRLGPLELVFLGDIESAQTIQYLYLLMAYRAGQELPIYCVSSEANALAGGMGGGSHFLCAFEGDKHSNYGSSDDWANYEKFADRALQMVKEKFKDLS